MEQANSTQIFLREGGQERQGRPATNQQQEPAVKPAEAIFCRACGGVVTGRDQRTQKNGSHGHTFFNPSGIVFELGCFLLAPGCMAIGAPSTEFTWFPGHIWRIVLCRHCRIHLGWLFTMEGNAFYGLILSKLRE
jgi:hypothetical protein